MKQHIKDTAVCLIILIGLTVGITGISYSVNEIWFSPEAPIETPRRTGSYTFNFTIPEGGVWVSPVVPEVPTQTV